MKSDKQLVFTGVTTNCEVCIRIYFTTDCEDHLCSEGHRNTEEEKQTNLKCNFCDRTILKIFLQKQETSVRHKKLLKHKAQTWLKKLLFHREKKQ